MELVIAEIRALPFIIEGSSKGEVETPAEKDNLLDKIQCQVTYLQEHSYTSKAFQKQCCVDAIMM